MWNECSTRLCKLFCFYHKVLGPLLYPYVAQRYADGLEASPVACNVTIKGHDEATQRDERISQLETGFRLLKSFFSTNGFWGWHWIILQNDVKLSCSIFRLVLEAFCWILRVPSGAREGALLYKFWMPYKQHAIYGETSQGHLTSSAHIASLSQEEPASITFPGEELYTVPN